MATPYIFIQNISDRSLNILHNEKDNFNYTPLKPNQMVTIELEIIDQWALIRMSQKELVDYSLIPEKEKEKIKYTPYNRFEIMDI